MKPKFIYRSEALFSFLGVDEKPEPSDFKYHTHLMCEIYYFIEGDAIFHVEGAQYRLKPGDILVMRPTEAHYVEMLSNQLKTQKIKSKYLLLMKTNYFRQLLIAIVAMLCSVAASAYDFEADGIFYHITSHQGLKVGVTYKSFNHFILR